MTDDQVMQHLQELRVSPVVAAYLDQRLFEGDQGTDTIVAQQIVNDCYAALVEELQDIGLTIINDDVILSNYQDAKHLVTIYSILHEHSARKYLPCISQEFRDDMGALLDDNFIDDDFVERLLKVLCKYSANDELVEALRWCPDHIVADTQLADALWFYLDYRMSETTSDDNASAICDYLIQTSLHRENVTATAELLSGVAVGEDLNNTYLDKLVHEYDADKCTSEEVLDYALCDRPDSEIPDYLKEHAKTIMDAHHKRASHHLEYWLARPLSSLTKADIIICICSIFDDGSDTDANEASETYNRWINSKILKDQEQVFINLYRIAQQHWLS